jgi:hypothetical protein
MRLILNGKAESDFVSINVDLLNRSSTSDSSDESTGWLAILTGEFEPGWKLSILAFYSNIPTAQELFHCDITGFFSTGFFRRTACQSQDQ